MSTTYEVVDGVAWLTIGRPQARTALTEDMRDGLWEGAAGAGGSCSPRGDAQEGPAACRDQRAPVWTGR